MSGKKWTRVWLNPNRPIACWPVEYKELCHAEFMQVEEHEHILSAEQRLNAMGQERELALMERVKELEKMLQVAVDCLREYSTAGFGINGQVFQVGSKAKQALAAIDNK